MSRPKRTLFSVALWLVFTAVGFALVRYFGPDISASLRSPAGINVYRIDVALPNLDGELKRLEDWRDGPMLVNFWATWCPPCRREIPMLTDLQERYGPAGLTVIGVAIDDTEAVRLYADGMDINYPILLGEEDGVTLSTAVGADILALPISVFVDRRGNVTRQHVGEIDLEDAEMALAEIIPET